MPPSSIYKKAKNTQSCWIPMPLEADEIVCDPYFRHHELNTMCGTVRVISHRYYSLPVVSDNWCVESEKGFTLCVCDWWATCTPNLKSHFKEGQTPAGEVRRLHSVRQWQIVEWWTEASRSNWEGFRTFAIQMVFFKSKNMEFMAPNVSSGRNSAAPAKIIKNLSFFLSSWIKNMSLLK